MLPKKFLSLSLAAGLAVSASSNVFALGGQSDVAPSPSATEYSKEISENDIITLILIPVCADILSNTIQPFIHLPKVLGLYQQLQELQKELRQELKQEELKQKVLKQLKQRKYNPKVTKFATTFLDLYNDKIHPEFKKAVDEAWVTDATGNKQHASIQDITNHFGEINDLSSTSRKEKHNTGFHGDIESKNNTTDKNVKRQTWGFHHSLSHKNSTDKHVKRQTWGFYHSLSHKNSTDKHVKRQTWGFNW